MAKETYFCRLYYFIVSNSKKFVEPKSLNFRIHDVCGFLSSLHDLELAVPVIYHGVEGENKIFHLILQRTPDFDVIYEKEIRLSFSTPMNDLVLMEEGPRIIFYLTPHPDKYAKWFKELMKFLGVPSDKLEVIS